MKEKYPELDVNVRPEDNEKIPEVLDADVFQRFEQNFIEEYGYISCSAEHLQKQKELFEAGDIENPTFEYPELHDAKFVRKELSLRELKQDILEGDFDERVRGAYKFKIDEQLDVLTMLRAAREGDDELFVEYSKKLYGEPSLEMYAYTLKNVQKTIEKGKESDDPLRREAALRLCDSVLMEDILSVDTSKIDSVRDAVSEKYYTEKSHVDEEPMTSYEIQAGFEEMLEAYDIDGWNVVIDETMLHRNLNVDQETKTVNIPNEEFLQSRKVPITPTKFKALSAHEIGTHVLRRDNGEKSPLKLLGFGLDGYLRAEEGIAKYSEQMVEGMHDFGHDISYWKIGLVLGIDGVQRNFRDVYSIMTDYEYIKSKKEGGEAMRAAKDAAWNGCVRTFRGTTGSTPGACYTKDVVYREGNFAIWDLLQKNPAMEKYLKAGKYDPTNRRHLALLKQLGIVS